MKRRLFSLLLTGAMLLSMCPPGLAAAGDVEYQYCDANGQNWQTGTKTSGDYAAVTDNDTAWADGWYVASGEVIIPSCVAATGDVHLILEDGCKLTVNGGIGVNGENRLVIYGQQGGTGALIVQNTKDFAAGIGGNNGQNCGIIVINGGSVTATGGYNGAGIGGGDGKDGGIITINGGTVIANGNHYAAGIGGGITGNGGIITINGGSVYGGGANAACGIGGGGNTNGGRGGSGGIITINGGTVTAEGAGVYAAAVGGGRGASGGTIILNGGVISAEGGSSASSGNRGVGIGNGGEGGYGASITTGANGTAFIKANTISGGTSGLTSCIYFNGNYGYVCGNQTLKTDLTLESNQRLTVTGNADLNVPSGITLTNNGTITNNGEIINNGVLTNNGTVNGIGSYSGSGTVNKANQTAPGNGEGYTIDCVTEKITIKSGYQVSSDKLSMIADQSTVAPGDSLSIRKEENNFYNASDWTDFITPNRETAPNVSINYIAETLSTSTAMEYSVDVSGHQWESCNDDMTAGDFGWDGSAETTVQFRTAATQSNYASAPQEVNIPARPSRPTPQGVNETIVGKNDGRITSVLTDMEYKRSGSNRWMACTSTEITGLEADIYQVRVKATTSTFASEAVRVTIGSGAEKTYTLNVTAPTFDPVDYGYLQPAAKPITITSTGNSDTTISSVTVSGSDFTIGGSGDTVTAGGSIDTWTVQPNAGLSAGEHTATITVSYNNGAAAEAQVSFKVNGAPQTAPAAGPVEKRKTHNSVTLEPVSSNDNGAAAEYSKDGGITWQTSPEFIGLTPSTKYTFVVRYGAIGSYEASPASPATEITTEAPPVMMYAVTVSGGTGDGEYAEGDTVTITATVPDGQRFTGWTVNEGGVTLANASSATTNFAMPAQNVTVTANFQSNSSGGSSSGGGGGNYTPPATTYPPTVERPGEGGGTVAVSPSDPKPGDNVTVKPRPDDGYEVDKITVTDQNGKPVEVTVKPDGTCTFQQPNGKVKIEVSYKAVQPVETPWKNPFSDVSESDWYYEAVRFVQERGLMDGIGNGNFAPNAQLSRAQLAQILFSKEGRPGVNYLLTFPDVADETWYTEAVRWAASQGIVGGYGNGTFGPNDSITREQLALMLWRYSGSPAAANKELHFNDTDEISVYALEALRWATENGILNGYGDGRLGHKGQATRAQAAQMLKNFVENQEDNAIQ